MTAVDERTFTFGEVVGALGVERAYLQALASRMAGDRLGAGNYRSYQRRHVSAMWLVACAGYGLRSPASVWVWGRGWPVEPMLVSTVGRVDVWLGSPPDGLVEVWERLDE